VSGPPTADPQTASFDLYFALAKETDFRPGERVAVTLTFRGDEAAIRLPASSVVRDVSGLAWVYESLPDHGYERRLVEVDRVEAGEAVVSRGIAEGTKVVTQGASQLFGVEFGSGK
jgi:cobalt-zinc-cadmium efflux system membrane fusion protein